jgi:hypothetical protein
MPRWYHGLVEVIAPREMRKTPMDPKPRPNHKRYIEILRGMSAEQKLNTVVDLTETGKALFRAGLRQRFPDATEEELHRIYLERLAKCHNRNY